MLSKQGCGFYLILASLGIAWGGAEGLHTWATNRKPLEVPCEAFEPHLLEEAQWFRLKDCEVDLTQALYFENRFLDTILEIFLPVRAPGASPEAPVHLLASTRNHRMRKWVEDLASREGDAREEFVTEHQERWIVRQDLEGMIRTALELDEEKRADFLLRNRALAKDFEVLDLGQKPTLRYLQALVLAPLAFLLGMALIIRRPKKSEEKAERTTSPKAPKANEKAENDSAAL